MLAASRAAPQAHPEQGGSIDGARPCPAAYHPPFLHFRAHSFVFLLSQRDLMEVLAHCSVGDRSRLK